jgi:hypothetical protein
MLLSNTQNPNEQICPKCGKQKRPRWRFNPDDPSRSLPPTEWYDCDCAVIKKWFGPEPENRTEKKEPNIQTIEYKKSVSLIKWLWCCVRNKKRLPNIWQVAAVGDTFIKLVKEKTVRQMAAQLGYEIKFRKDISDWQRRRLPKMRMGKITWYFKRLPKSNTYAPRPYGLRRVCEY